MQVQSFTSEPELLTEFVELPFAIRQGDTRWVPPMRDSVMAELGDQNPFFQHGRRIAFLARDSAGKPVGRCVASRDPRLDQGDLRPGMVGYFEVVEDYEVASALLDAARLWLAEQGATEVWGPLDLSIFNRYRFMTKGFECEPFLGEPDNPAFYARFFEQYGFAVAEASASWDLDEDHVQEILRATAARYDEPRLREAGYSIRRLDQSRFDDEFRLFYELTTDSFREHTGYVPLGFEEFAFFNSGAKLFFASAALHFLVGPDGDEQGATYAYPDYSEVIRELGGTLDLARLPALLAEKKPTRAVLHTGMIREGHRHIGGMPGLFVNSLTDLVQSGLPCAIGAFAKLGKGSPFEKAYSIAPRNREYALYRLVLPS